MSYVVVNLGTTQIKESYKYFYHAKNLADKLNALEVRRALRGERYAPDVVYAAYEYEFWFRYIRYQKTVKNFMTGTLVSQWSDTPLSCDVSRETYWSM